MKHLKLLLVLLMIGVLFSGCASKNALVTVNGHAITQADFDREFAKVENNPELKQQGVNLKDPQNKSLYLLVKGRVMDELVVKTILDDEMKKLNITVSDEEFKKGYDEIINAIGSEAKFKEALKTAGVSEAQFKIDLKDELMKRKFIEQVAKINVSDNEAEKFYNANRKDFNMPDRVRASHILISANPDEMKVIIASDESSKKLSAEDIDKIVKERMAEKLKEAQAILAEVKKNPASFEKMAREKSDDKASAIQGGDLGEFAAGQMVEPFSKAAFALKPNTVSDIVVTPYGYHIIMVKDRIKAGIVPFAKVKEELKAKIAMQETTKKLAQFFENAKRAAKIEYNDKAYDPAVIQEEIRKTAKQEADKQEALPTKLK